MSELVTSIAKKAMVVRSMHKMKAKAAACVAVGGGVLEGRKV